MRILQIQFKNLNSLLGEWRVDFTHPSYVADGIFAITGPTGAGKTTLLDAICLGLYGQTPRLPTISKSSNEILSRQAGECFAEVTFETEQGRYRCHWAQHRARRKSGIQHKLQDAKHEISNAHTGEVLASKLHDVHKQVQALTGMAFEQFTRSVMLAQGGFAAFLQAKVDERSPILEQITGTDIYSAISQQVHQRWSQEKQHLQGIQLELGGLQLLSHEEEQALQAEQAHLQAQTADLAERCQQTQAALNGLQAIAKLEQQLRILEQQWQDFNTQQQALQPQLQQLQKATKALQISALYTELERLRCIQEEEQTVLIQLNERIEQQQTQVTQLQKEESSATQEMHTALAAKQQAIPIIRQVRELDKEIERRQQNQREQHSKHKHLRRQLGAQQAQIERQEQTLIGQQQELSQCQAYLAEHASDASLLESLTGIEKSFESWTASEQQYNTLQQALQKAEKSLIQAQKNNAEREQDVLQWRQQITQSEQIEQNVHKQVETLLDGRSARAWRDESDTLKERLHSVVEMDTYEQSIQTKQQVINTLNNRSAALSQEQDHLNHRLEALDAEQNQQQNTLEHLQEKILLLQRIRDLEQERSRLQDGQPCPLCGALQHPYAHGNTPLLETVEIESQALKKSLSERGQQIESLRTKQTELNTERKHIQSDIESQSKQLAADQRAFTQTCHQLALNPQQLNSEQERLQQAIQHINERLSTLDRLESQEKAERSQLSRLRASLAESEKKWRAVQQKAEHAAQQQQHFLQEIERAQQQQQRLRQRLCEELADYRLQSLDFAALSVAQNELRQRRDRWREQLDLCRKCEINISALSSEIKAQKIVRRKLQNDLQSLELEQAQLDRHLSQQRQSRATLYADKNPDTEEQHLENQYAQAQEALQQAQKTSQHVQHETDFTRREQKRLTSAIQQREHALSKAQDQFRQQLAAQHFRDEADYQAALMDETRKQTLEQQAETLQRRRTELETRRQDTEAALQVERAKVLSEHSEERLQSELKSHSQALQEAQQGLGAVQAHLDQNSQQQSRQHERLQRLQAQRQECERWDRLHELIGSADGKKYRNFAQGLTFELMVAQANRQLLKMTDRYLLLHDAKRPLELNVIDQYQASDVRSTKNLSGGESFIVSLALALGLAQMASRNVRVDSLFLDEGFGTLDEDALETALSALASLHQQGKLIGVISHVAALKERISAQIQVIPQTGGRSRLLGPGCSACEENA